MTPALSARRSLTESPDPAYLPASGVRDFTAVTCVFEPMIPMAKPVGPPRRKQIKPPPAPDPAPTGEFYNAVQELLCIREQDARVLYPRGQRKPSLENYDESPSLF